MSAANVAIVRCACEAYARGDYETSIEYERARGKESGVEVEQSVHQVWTLRDGKVARMQGFFDREEALAVAGFS